MISKDTETLNSYFITGLDSNGRRINEYVEAEYEADALGIIYKIYGGIYPYEIVKISLLEAYNIDEER